ncbi:MAG: hypothetical protein KAW14_03995 [Candidatus Aegiribacteria sp.]|nr:hypothetical protein [Candidatus Aegiribacteria sp.]
MILTLFSVSVQNQADLHDFTVINEVRDLEIVSLYVWCVGHNSKGDNRLHSSLQPDSSVTFTLPSGKCNILAFDELGNSYGIAGNYQKNAPDTITIDLEYITFGRPNVDYGYYLLSLTNSLLGFALDTLILSSDLLAENIIIDDYRIFPGTSIIIWLDEGIYSVNAVDQIGRTYSTNNITVPTDSCMVSIIDSMISNPQPPVGITGNGTGSLLIKNCLPTAEITELQIIPQNGSDGIFLDSIALQPGVSMVAKLNPGIYSITATDEFGAKYIISFEQQDTDIIRLPITYESLQYDFSFPINSQEQ